MNKWPFYKSVGRTWKFKAAKYYNRGKLMRQIKTEETWKQRFCSNKRHGKDLALVYPIDHPKL